MGKLKRRTTAGFIWTACGVFGILSGLLVVALPGLALRRRVARLAARGLLRLGGWPLDVTGLEELPVSGCIVVANHASYLDGVILTAALPPRFSFVIKREITAVPLVATLLRRLGSQFVDRSGRQGSATDAGRLFRAARRGEALGVFPEGTFVAAPGIRPFRLGAFLAAARNNLPVIPVGIRGSRRALPAECWTPTQGVIRVLVGSARHAPSTDRTGAVKLMEETRSIVANLADEREA